MKKKTINTVIGKKINEWLASIDDEVLRKDVSKNVIVTGGCITSMLLRESINDFDVYFRTRDITKRIAEYYVARFNVKNKAGIPCPIYVEDADDRIKIVVKSAGVSSEEGTDKEYQYFENRPPDEAQDYIGEIMGNPSEIIDLMDDKNDEIKSDDGGKYRPIFLSTNAITLSGKLQLILRFYGEPDEIHANYDFVHCTNYWDSKTKTTILNQAALESILTKELIYVGSKYPLCSIIRTRKFIQRNWTINAGQYLKMAMQLNELNLTDLSTLEDQLTGVDTAYFTEVIKKLRDKGGAFERTYICEIIDRMF